MFMLDLSQPPIYIIRTGDGAQGEPYLEVKITSFYKFLYNDRGTGGSHDVTIYRPTPVDNSYYFIGDYAQNNYHAPTGSSPIVRAINDDPANPLIMPPVSYSQVWNDKGSGGDHDGSIWFPIPNDGYVSIGFLGQTGYSMPTGLSYACLRKDLVEKSTAGPVIWNDRKSGANQDVTLFEINGEQCVFLAQPNYDPYSGQCYRLKPNV
jgi:VPS62-like protein